MNIAKIVFDQAETHPDAVKEMLLELSERGEKVSEILDFVKELEKRKITVPNPQKEKIFDVCGTGGSGKKRINLSTILAIKLSKKFKIAKHGNKAASGRVGSFDLIEYAGFTVCDTPEKVQKKLKEKNLAFVFAPAFHPTLKILAPIRKMIPNATIFNFLGPLLNPVENLTAQMVGVPSVSIGEKLSEVSKYLGKNILFVHDNFFSLDDVSIGGETIFWEVQNEKITMGKFFPEDFGLKRITDFKKISGGDSVARNFEIFSELMSEKAPQSHLDFLEINKKVATNFFEKF